MATAATAEELSPDALWQRIKAAYRSAEAHGAAYKCGGLAPPVVWPQSDSLSSKPFLSPALQSARLSSGHLFQSS